MWSSRRACSWREGFVGQTQTAYADAEGVHVFNHPLDFHFMAASLDGWPQLQLQVLKLDDAGCVEPVSYASLPLPVTPGHAELVCKTWAPVGTSLLGEARTAHGAAVGRYSHAASLAAKVLDGGLPEARAQLLTKSSGIVRISLDTVFRNAVHHGILPATKMRQHHR
eukprot:TRINITY_DN42419_c0_g2_i4.p2 TRINITY_DN42419_c0_g2~~TRINITY_DN42419_c0_g2_i4.p2  ORF type:complete len:167 (-),score=26.67 TRINITY_DN42419_c0_g2_i4:34-534(-)